MPLVSFSDIITRVGVIHMVHLPVPNRREKGVETSRVHDSYLSGKVLRRCPNFLLTSLWLDFRHKIIPSHREGKPSLPEDKENVFWGMIMQIRHAWNTSFLPSWGSCSGTCSIFFSSGKYFSQTREKPVCPRTVAIRHDQL